MKLVDLKRNPCLILGLLENAPEGFFFTHNICCRAMILKLFGLKVPSYS